MRRPSYTQTVAPTTDPVSLELVKDHLRVTDAPEEDDAIKAIIEDATAYIQEYQWSQLMPATWELRIDDFPDKIELHPNPVSSVSSLKYYDTTGTQQTLTADTDYVVDTTRHPALIYPAYNAVWPVARGVENDVLATFVAGYASETTLPRATRRGLLMLIEYLYENRGGGCSGANEIPHFIRAALDVNSFRVYY